MQMTRPTRTIKLALNIEKGRLRMLGDPKTVCEAYHKYEGE